MSFGILIYGVKKADIGLDEVLIKCPSCEKDTYADIMVISNYYHFWYLPIFPIDKEANIICQQCGLKRYGVPFNARTFSNFSEIRHKFKHPWYTYITAAFLGLMILLSILLK